MKQLVTSILMGACAATALAAAPVAEMTAKLPAKADLLTIREVLPQQRTAKALRIFEPKNLAATQYAAPTSRRARAAFNAADYNDKGFVVLYDDDYDDLNGGMYISINGTEVSFDGLLGGLEVKGTLDEATGTASIPTGGVIGSHDTYGNITLLASDGYDEPLENVTSITATFADGKVTFDCGMSASVAAGDLVVMKNVEALPATGTFSASDSEGSYMFPLLVTKKGTDRLEVIGISSFMYAYRQPVVFPIDEATMTSTLPALTPFDSQYTQTGYVNWSLCDLDAESNIIDLELAITVADGASKLTSPTAAMVYRGTTGYRGFMLQNFSITADFDIFDNSNVVPDAPIVGNEYVVLYNDGIDDMNIGMTVEADNGNNVVLAGILSGYDVKAVYNETDNTLTIPTGVVVGSHSSYGAITLYTLYVDETGAYLDNTDVTGTIGEDGVITFDNALIGQVSAGTLARLSEANAVPANAKLQMVNNNTIFATPLLIEKTTETQLKVTGISSLYAGDRQIVPMTLDTNDHTATIEHPTLFDRPYSDGNYIPTYLTANGTGGDVVFSISVADDKSTMAAPQMFFSPKSGDTYTAKYKFTDVKILADHDIEAAIPTDAIERVEAAAVIANGIATYYNLAGIRVSTPTAGLYIRVAADGTVSKVAVK